MPIYPHYARHFFVLSALYLAANARIVVTIENTDPRIAYLPSVCNDFSQTNCTAPWQLLALPGASSGSVTTTSGPVPAADDLLPQLFLTLRGTSLVLRTSTLSNATANITLTASPSGLSVTTTLDSSEGSLSALNLPPDQDITLTLTYIPSANGPTRLDIDSVTVWAQNSSETSLSPLPLPSSSFLPSFVVPAPTATPSHHEAHLVQPKGTIIGEALAGFFGLILIAAGMVSFVKWKRQREARDTEAFELRTRRKGKRREPSPP
ncbi:hypothetical protein BV25DRAFT_1829532 [Artomyces pyxidatus]|uniref:Uncharacterized protein n=1 Tax=Artomyces pyxidatus TaxID=48021 RepID=A0ACB8SS08_9AGAM|nr:hypothetical protein BV25DRAFT_1829532 [Artomyces pyxidatus]